MIAPNAPPQLRHWSSGCIHKEASFVSLDDLDKISVLLEEDNHLEEEITHLFNEISIFISKFEKKHSQSGSKFTQNMYLNTR